MQRTPLVPLGLLTVLLATVGCGDNGGTSATGSNTGTDPTEAGTMSAGSTGTATDDTAGTTETTDEPTAGTTETPTTGNACMEGMSMPGAGAEGSPCTANADCESESCIEWTDTQTDAVCGPRAECGNTRFVGTLFDFDTKEPIAGGELTVVGALAALGGLDSATPLVEATAGANGQIDATSAEPLNQGIGVIGVVTGGAYYVTATGLAQPYPMTPMYPPLNGIHDIWGVPSAKLTEWSGYLMTDPDMVVVDGLPLGDKGGVIGLVRDGTGAGVAEGVVVSSKGAESTAVVRYLNEDGMGFNADGTSSNGVFVLVNPGLAEVFTVDVAGTPTGLTGTAGSAENAAFVLIFNVP
jgi:hypothetical protein